MAQQFGSAATKSLGDSLTGLYSAQQAIDSDVKKVQGDMAKVQTTLTSRRTRLRRTS